MKCLIVIAGAIPAIGAGVFLYAWTGIYNIAATEPHWGITFDFIEMLKDRSVAARSGDVEAPAPERPEIRRQALPHYHEMCRLCHGAPGYAPYEFAAGLYPSPPEMASGRIQAGWNDAELYWIVKHGLKMTGMPAFGPTHDEAEIWGLVVLSRQMPGMSPEEYRRALEQVYGKKSGKENGHEHQEHDEMTGHGHGEESHENGRHHRH